MCICACAKFRVDNVIYPGYNNRGAKRGQKYGRSRDRNPIKSQNRDYHSLEKLNEMIRAKGERYLNMDNRACQAQPLRGRRGGSVNRLWTRERRISVRTCASTSRVPKSDFLVKVTKLKLLAPEKNAVA